MEKHLDAFVPAESAPILKLGALPEAGDAVVEFAEAASERLPGRAYVLAADVAGAVECVDRNAQRVHVHRLQVHQQLRHALAVLHRLLCEEERCLEDCAEAHRFCTHFPSTPGRWFLRRMRVNTAFTGTQDNRG